MIIKSQEPTFYYKLIFRSFYEKPLVLISSGLCEKMGDKGPLKQTVYWVKSESQWNVGRVG